MHTAAEHPGSTSALEAGVEMTALKPVSGVFRSTGDSRPDRQFGRDHVPRTFPADPRPPIARQPRHLRARLPAKHRCGAGSRSEIAQKTRPLRLDWLRDRGLRRWKRWKIKAKGDAVRHPQFRRRHRLGTVELLQQDGITGVRACRTCCGSPGCSPGCCARFSAPGSPSSCPASTLEPGPRALIA